MPPLKEHGRDPIGPALWTYPSAALAIHYMIVTTQEGEVNTSDLADPRIMAIMTSRLKKRANAENFRKWRRHL